MKKNYLWGRFFLFAVLFGLSFKISAQNQQQVEKIKQGYNLVKLEKIKQHLEKVAKQEKQLALQIAKQKGWKEKIILQDGRMLELQKVDGGKPIYYTTFNVDAARSTRTNHLHSGGSLGLNLMGQGMTAYVWDGGGTRITHQEFDGAGGTNRVSIIDGSTLNSNSFHAQHVTGTIVASGVQANAKGMAPHAQAKTADWNNDKAEATAEVSNGMLVSNHSYGFAFRNQFGQVQLPQHYFGGYIDESRDWDEIMFNAPNYLMVVAAGNDGNDNTANNNPTGGAGWDKLTGHSTSKNNLVVANAQDANIDANGNLISVSINSSSSEGPTDDMRIKPDITGNGTSVYSTYDNSDTAYNSISGTSMASPNVTGSLVLLQQHYKNLNTGSFMKAATLKGLALHTADDAGVNGPDAVFGWGLLNAKRAAETISKNGNESKIEELTLNSGQTYTINVDSDGTSPLMASISWTDRAGVSNTTVNSTTPVLVNDLDIRVTKSGTTHLPYKLTSPTTSAQQDNNVDPYERVDVTGASGTYTITVTHKGSLTGGSQNFSLIITGLTGTPVVCNATVPTGVSTSNITSSGATVSWTAVPSATYDVRYRQTGTTNWTTNAVSGTSTTLNGLNASTQYEVQVRSKCSDGSNSNYSTSVNFTTTAVQINYCTSSGNTSYQTGISRVVFGTIDNADGPAKNVGYEDFTNLSTTVAQSSSVDLTVSVNTDGNYRVDAIAWIDWNQDGDFTDSGETFDLGNISNVSNGALPTLAVTVPANAQLGNTRMRVSAKYNANPTSCETNFDGEVEDYTIAINTAQADTQAPTAPTNLTASNITQTTASLSWTASTDNVGVTEYEVFSSGTSIGTVTGTSANITGLTANTSYTYIVRAKDAAGNVSADSNAVTFTTLSNQVSYCASQGNNSSYEWIDYVAFGGMTNSTGNNGGYEDFTNKVATVAKGSTNQLTISAGFSSSSYTEYWAIWIDYNQDGTFADTEKVASGSSSSSGNLVANVTIPSTANTGQTRMRVSMKYNSTQTACETFTYGEVEDYTVDITNSTSSLYTTFNEASGNPLGNEASSYLSVFPNPAVNSIQIKLGRTQNLSYRIINYAGQLVKKGKTTGNEINISHLRPGMYLLEANDGQKPFTIKFIKQ